MTKRKGGLQKSSRRRPASAGKRVSKGMSKRRRPTSRAQTSHANRRKQPMPKPPARRNIRRAAAAAGGAAAVAAAGSAVELRSRVHELQNEFAGLEAKAQLSNLYDAIGSFDERLLELPTRLEKLRDRGYVHSGYLEDSLDALDDKWDEIRPRVEATLRTHVRRLDRELEEAERQIDRLRPTSSSVRQGETLINGLSQRINAAIQAVEGLYDGLDTDLDQMGWTLHKFEQVMDQIDESPHIKLTAEEGPLAAVKAEWQRDGDNGPEGVLVLTDQRIFFEQREEVVTKRRLGIFKAESEMIQELHIEAQISEIEQAEASEKGGFLGMGKDDILELTFAATAPVSRARFHLQGQDSEEWRTLIKKAQSGELDDDRADEYEDELETLAETAASFPTACPNCFGAVPPPARGVTSVTCEFCGTVITPTSAA